MAKKKKVVQKQTKLLWIVPLVLVLFCALLLFPKLKHMQNKNLTTYTNPAGTVSVEYPADWTVKQVHEVSNREVDNPKEINTAVLIGDAGQVVIQWGPMGFGGGCDEKDNKTLTIKNKTLKVCNGILPDGTEYWSQISNGAQDERITGVRALANKPTEKNSQQVKDILSSLNFK